MMNTSTRSITTLEKYKKLRKKESETVQKLKESGEKKSKESSKHAHKK